MEVATRGRMSADASAGLCIGECTGCVALVGSCCRSFRWAATMGKRCTEQLDEVHSASGMAGVCLTHGGLVEVRVKV